MTLFVCDEMWPLVSAPAVRMRSLGGTFDGDSVLFVGGASERLAEVEPGWWPVYRPGERRVLPFAWFLVRLMAKYIVRLWRDRVTVLVLSVPKYELLLTIPLARRMVRWVVLDIRDSHEFLDYEAYLRHALPSALAKRLGAGLSLLAAAALKHALKQADLVTAATSETADGLRRLHPGVRVEVISNGVEEQWFNIGHTRLKQAADARARTFALNVAYVGNFVEKDDLRFCAEGLRGYEASAVLHLFGDGRNRQRACDDLESLGLAPVYHGQVDHAELPECLAGIDLGILFRTSGEDSVPVSLMEFAALGIPVVCNDVGAMARFVKAEGIGWVVERPSQFGELISHFSSHPDSLKVPGLSVGAQARLSRSAQALRFHHLVTEMCSARSPGASG